MLIFVVGFALKKVISQISPFCSSFIVMAICFPSIWLPKKVLYINEAIITSQLYIHVCIKYVRFRDRGKQKPLNAFFHTVRHLLLSNVKCLV